MTARLIAALVLALFAVTACSPDYPAGPTGKVTDRTRAYYKADGWHYWLTVDGTKFRVIRDDYRHCVRGSSYPVCTQKGK